jgi:Xaa-Pro aminopeptidase
MKLKQLQKYLGKNNFDLAFLVHPDSNITYFSQAKPSFALLQVFPDDAVLYISKLDATKTKISVDTLPKKWEKHLEDKKVKKVGINKESLTISFLDKLKKIYPKAKFIDISKEIKKLRMKKTEEEIKKISKACQITSTAYNDLIESLPKLKTEQDIAFFLDKRIRELGAEGNAFPTVIAMGKNAAIPHHETSRTKLKRGFLLLDFGACYKNYCADMSRVLFLGTANKEEKERYNLLLDVQQNAIKQIKEKKKFIDLDKEARKNLGKYSSYFIHSLGHGVGIDVHEAPTFKNAIIEKQNVFTIEPGIYFPKKFGLRIEDTVLFDKKAKVLTKAGKEFITI